ncbi:MAG: hypothetical protein J6Y00_00815 [Paludibacteraceae bacterium]|nr:hypothetical protein [Paludibacteraceae bacterium]
MKKVFSYIMVACMALPVFAAKEKHAAVFEAPQAYSCVFINVATAGTKNVKVSGEAKKKDAAIERAGMNAIHAAIFQGLPGGSNGQPTPALYPSTQPSADHMQYFDDFFNSGQYTNYLTQVANPSGKDMTEIKGGLRVKVEIQVMFDKLRSDLVAAGIIKGLADALEGAQKPTIMIFPDDDWCKANNYVMDDNPKTVDYDKALADVNMKDLINEFDNFMKTVANFPTERLDATLKDYRNEKAWAAADEMDDGEGNAGGAREMLASAASADIVIAFYPETRMDAGKQYVVFRISAIDVSTNKSVYSMSAQGTATYGSGQMVNQLKEAILNVKDEFLSSLQSTFNDMQKKGREVRITIQRKENCPINFAKRYEAGPLSQYIYDWIEEEVQTPGFTPGKNTANKLMYKQIYIPLIIERKNTKGKVVRSAQTAGDFATRLADYITELTGQPCRVDARSIGYAVITLGQDDSLSDE